MYPNYLQYRKAVSAMTSVLITTLVCLTIFFLALLFGYEIGGYINAKADEIRTRTAMLKEEHNRKTNECDTEVFGKEGTE